jgi:type III pantothenate kinase
MQLVIDQGNTRLKLGVFEGNALLEQAIWTQWTLEELLGWVQQFPINKGILCSVAGPAAAIIDALAPRFFFTALGHQTPLPFVNTYATPETLGKDRLAVVAGAQQMFPDSACMVIDSGTCIKYECLSADGQYLGGNIAPGVHMRTRAMHEFTARLPLVEQHIPDSPIGDRTVSALQNGAYRGLLLEIEGFIGLFQAHLGTPLQIVLTGGDAPFLAQHLNLPLQVVPHLTLLGLNAILNHIKP